MQKKFVINRTKIKGGCQSGRKVVTHNSKSDLLLGQAQWILSHAETVITVKRDAVSHRQEETRL